MNKNERTLPRIQYLKNLTRLPQLALNKMQRTKVYSRDYNAKHPSYGRRCVEKNLM